MRLARKSYMSPHNMGHVWKRNDYDRGIDIFGFSEGDHHNGPVCVNCGYGFCHHCEDKPSHVCPNAKAKAKKPVSRTRRTGA